jgi:hypothetical protein
MKRALWLLTAVLPAMAQPKLLINAQLDTRSAASGLETVFRGLLAAQPQPAWIAYAVPLVRGHNLGCEYVSPGGRTAPGVVHLEAPDQAIVLFRLEGSAVNRIRVVSPDCEIDAGNVPVHWLTDVRPAESVALLGTFDFYFNETTSAIALHADPSADTALEAMVASSQPEKVRQRAAFWLGAARGRRGFDRAKDLIDHDPSQSVRQRAVEGIAASKEPEALDTLIAIARKESDSRVRRQAVNAISRSRDPKAQAFLEDVLKR